MSIQARIDDRDVQRALKEILRKARDLTPVMDETGDIIISSAEKNLEEGGRYSSPDSWRGGSKKFEDLADSTIKNRQRRGYWPGKILVMRGEMAASISKTVTGDSVEVGSNKKHAALQHYGGKAGRGGKVNVPARPWLVVQDEDLKEIKDAARHYLVKG